MSLVSVSRGSALKLRNSWSGPFALDEVAGISSGYWGDSDSSSDRPLPVHVVRNGDIGRDGTLGECAQRFFSARECERARVVEGDVLLTSSGDVGKIHVSARADLFVSNFVKRLRPRADLLNARFLAYSLQTEFAREVIKRHTGGTTLMNLRASFFQDPWLHLPPLGEQQRIVTKLDEILSRTRVLTQALERTQSSLTALTKAAVARRFEQAPERRSLGELCSITTGRKDVNQGNPKGIFPFFTCAEKPTYSDSYSFDCEAILIAGNGNVGQASYYSGKFEVYQRTYVLSDFRGIDGSLLYAYLARFLTDALRSQTRGNTIPYIKLGMLKEVPIPVPLPEQQRELQAHIYKLDALMDALMAVRRQGILRSRQLEQRVLSSAFNGEL